MAKGGWRVKKVTIMAYSTEDKFLVPALGNIVDSGTGCRSGPPGYTGWQADMTTLCQSPESTISPSQGLEFSLRSIDRSSKHLENK